MLRDGSIDPLRDHSVTWVSVRDRIVIGGDPPLAVRPRMAGTLTSPGTRSSAKGPQRTAHSVKRNKPLALVVGAGLVTLAACGGGSSDDGDTGGGA